MLDARSDALPILSQYDPRRSLFGADSKFPVGVLAQSENSPTLSPFFWCPRPDLNRDPRFRKPLLYPVELRGRGNPPNLDGSARVWQAKNAG